MSGWLDYNSGSGEAGYTGILPGDINDTAQMQPFAPEGTPWWQAIIMYGATRAIDNRYGPVNVQGNTSPGYFAGQNGATYQNTATPTLAGGIPGWLLLAGVGALVFALAR